MQVSGSLMNCFVIPRPIPEAPPVHKSVKLCHYERCQAHTGNDDATLGCHHSIESRVIVTVTQDFPGTNTIYRCTFRPDLHATFFPSRSLHIRADGGFPGIYSLAEVRLHFLYPKRVL